MWWLLKCWMKVKVAQLCLTLCDPMDYTVHGTLQASIREWVAFPFSSRSSKPRDRTQVSSIAGGFFTSWATKEAQENWSGKPIPSAADLPDPGIERGSPTLQADSLPTELLNGGPNTDRGWCPSLRSWFSPPTNISQNAHRRKADGTWNTSLCWPESCWVNLPQCLSIPPLVHFLQER